MFYSHTFLARKGPLGTVWCAAHLQHKLKKSHYTSTDIPSTVERIMCPEVPIALRMSGHLLLGVVRIYSKKVDYLYHDCNSLWGSLRSAFRPVNVNLQENATHAQFNSITLAENYELDAQDINPEASLDDQTQDYHLKSQEEIRLTDQYSFGEEHFVVITLDDNVTQDSLHSQASPHGEHDPRQTAPQEPVTHNRADGDGDHHPSRPSEDRHETFGEGSSLQIPDTDDFGGILRDNIPGDDNPILLQDELISLEPNASPQKETPMKEADVSPLEDILTPQLQSHPSSHQPGPSSPPHDEALGGSHSFGPNATPLELAIRPSPAAGKPQGRQRKRKQFFDESLVLTNEFLKNALNNTSNLVKKRKKLPCSALDMWRFRNNKKKQHIFSESLISGFCAELQTLSSDFLIFEKRVIEEVQQETRAAQSPAARVPDTEMETEQLRDADHDLGYAHVNEVFTPQHSQGNGQTSASPSHSQDRISESASEPRFDATIDPVSEPRFGTTIGSESDRGMFTGSVGLGLETPYTDLEDQAALSDIPELRGSAELDELSFLEQDNNTPPDSQGPRESDTMSVRTRAVAQYLKNHSPGSKYSGSPREELSLNSIVEGRSRKLCARMFYETLVLKDYGLIDVKQDEPYGDITLKLTPTLSMAKI